MYFAERTGARVYFPHISSRLALDEVRRWRKRYDQVWIETCPHYLTHTEDSDLGGIGRANPPFRTKDDQDALWEALFDGTIDIVASDHSARRRVTKDKPLWLAAQGFPGIAAILPVLLSEGYHKRQASAAADLPAARRCAREDLRPRHRPRATSRRATTPTSRWSISARSASSCRPSWARTPTTASTRTRS